MSGRDCLADSSPVLPRTMCGIFVTCVTVIAFSCTSSRACVYGSAFPYLHHITTYPDLKTAS